MGRALALLALLWLSACFESRPPDLPRAALVQPADLSGPFWSVSLADPSESPGIGTFGHAADGSLTLVTTGGDRTSPRFRLVEAIPPDLYVMVADYDEDRVMYLLLERRASGAWLESAIETYGADGLGAARLARAGAVAARHGLTLDGSDRDKVRIEGPLDGMAIPDLFRDRAFLATLRVLPAVLYLPAPREPASPAREEPLFPKGSPGVGMLVAARTLPGANWLQPAWMAGRYRMTQVGGVPVSTGETMVRRLPDGRFEARSPGGTERIGLLALGSNGEEYLAVQDRGETGGNPAGPVLSLSIIRKVPAGWESSAVLVRGTADQPGRLDLAAEAMAAPIAERRLKLDGNVLSGAVTAGSLLGLVRDGRFAVGLQASRDDRMLYARH